MRRAFLVLSFLPLGCASDPIPAEPSDAGPAACPNDLPAACPADVPSYTRDVAPLLQYRCLMCHAPGGVAQDRDFSAYQGVFANKSAMLNQVYACRMPPADAAPPSPAEREALLTWLVCHAPNN